MVAQSQYWVKKLMFTSFQISFSSQLFYLKKEEVEPLLLTAVWAHPPPDHQQVVPSCSRKTIQDFAWKLAFFFQAHYSIVVVANLVFLLFANPCFLLVIRELHEQSVKGLDLQFYDFQLLQKDASVNVHPYFSYNYFLQSSHLYVWQLVPINIAVRRSSSSLSGSSTSSSYFIAQSRNLVYPSNAHFQSLRFSSYLSNYQISSY